MGAGPGRGDAAVRGWTVSPADIAARLRAAGDTEAADAIDRLLGIIRRNREAFDAVKADGNQWRDRALRAEGRAFMDEFMDALRGLGGRR